MKLELYTIFDRASKVHKYPMFQRSKGDAIRVLTTGVNDPKTEIAQYPDDFDLYAIGTMDDETGVFIALPIPALVLSAKELIKVEDVR